MLAVDNELSRISKERVYKIVDGINLKVQIENISNKDFTFNHVLLIKYMNKLFLFGGRNVKDKIRDYLGFEVTEDDISKNPNLLKLYKEIYEENTSKELIK